MFFVNVSLVEWATDDGPPKNILYKKHRPRLVDDAGRRAVHMRNKTTQFMKKINVFLVNYLYNSHYIVEK